MANQEHFDLLRQGVPAWNAWRKEHPEIRPDLSEAELSKADLSGADLRRADLRMIILSRAELRDTYLIQADLSGATIRNANLNGAILRRALISNADLDKVNLREAYLDRVDLSGTNISGADLRLADLSNAILREADFSKAALSKAELIEADLSAAILIGTDLSYANLSRATLCDADLSKTILKGANLREANLSGAALSFADLTGTYLDSSDLTGAILMGADLSDVHLDSANLSRAVIGQTTFGNNDLRSVKGLETVIHWSPSTIGTNTLERSKGEIPEVFLRGAGLSNSFIEYARSLSALPGEYYTCVISHADEDEVFVRRLLADLQQHGVRCWSDPESLQVGDKLWHRLDESISMYDKLLIVLSAHSAGKAWVEREVMIALEQEQQRHATILYPIALDESVQLAQSVWSDSIRSRLTGDFSHWQDPELYQQALAHLLHDLLIGNMSP